MNTWDIMIEAEFEIIFFRINGYYIMEIDEHTLIVNNAQITFQGCKILSCVLQKKGQEDA
jgi:hypothetical protein